MSNRLATVFDLLVGLAFVGAAAGVVLVEPFGSGVLRTALVLPVLLFFPGYALVSFLYPDLPGDPATRDREGWSLTSLERVGLAVAASVAIVPLIGLVLNFTPYGVRARPVMLGIVAVTVLLTVGALVTRLRVPAERRFRPAVFAWLQSSVGTYLGKNQSSVRKRRPFQVQNNRHRILNLLLVGAVLLLFASVAYAAAGPTLPSQDGSYTELLLVDENGNLLGTEADIDGGSVPATVVVGNHEGATETYNVVLQRQQVSISGDRTQVEQTSVVETVERTVEDGETSRIDRTFEGGDENTRVQVLLFRGDVPSNPTADDAYRVTRFWPSGNATESGG